MSNPLRPKTLRGAFVEYGISLPPLFVVFQFNPEELTRSRSLSFAAPGDQVICEAPEGETEESRDRRLARRHTSLRDFHNQDFRDGDGPGAGNVEDLMAIQERQQVSIQEESISFDIRLDASDDLADGDPIATALGIAPRLATLELMTHPKGDSLLGAAADALLGLGDGGFSFTKNENPPMVLFIWGLSNVLPVNINSLSITENEFSRWLMPTRATVSVNLTVIEGKSIPFMYSKALKEVSSVLNLANIAEVANVVVPG
jgi:hypothetical protein